MHGLTWLLTLLTLLSAALSQRVYNDPHFVSERSVIVHLHEWTFEDIARECEEFLGPKGYGGVQTSPVSENVILEGRPWYERYQPISYQIATRSGNATAFYDMTQRCNAAGVRIYVDVVPNHMSANIPNAIGTGGSFADTENFDYPAVPYSREDFHQPPCAIEDFNDPLTARICELVGLHDLDQSLPRVRWAIINFLDRLSALGAAGFRVDASKHMFPHDLQQIYANIRNLPVSLGFAAEQQPFIYQEVGDSWKFNYTHLGAVTEFAHATNMAAFFKGQTNVTALRGYGKNRAQLLDSAHALIFVDNHDLQRQNPFTLNYKSARAFKAAYAFTLAYPYGIVRVMSSFHFNDDAAGPPHDESYQILRPQFDAEQQCSNGWVCEHRWTAIVALVRFRQFVADAALQHWWDDGNGVLSFCRGNSGFFAVSAGRYDFADMLQTCLPAGRYCNALLPRNAAGYCAESNIVEVQANGSAHIRLLKDAPELAVALTLEDLI